jgi:hypothetical protein
MTPEKFISISQGSIILHEIIMDYNVRALKLWIEYDILVDKLVELDLKCGRYEIIIKVRKQIARSYSVNITESEHMIYFEVDLIYNHNKRTKKRKTKTLQRQKTRIGNNIIFNILFEDILDSEMVYLQNTIDI